MGSALEALANTPDPQPPNPSGMSALEQLANMPDNPPDQGITRNSDNSFVITPTDDESFSDTMKRAAAMGKTVTPQQIQSQAKKGLQEAPTVLAAAPAAGFAGAAGLAGLGELGAVTPKVAKAVLAHVSQPGTILKFPFGRAVEYYLLGKAGVKQSTLKQIASHLD
jgi:hypothetical protein